MTQIPTRATNPLQLLTLELETRSASPSGRRAMDRIRMSGVDVGTTTTMAELVAGCHEAEPGGEDRTPRVVDALLAAARNDPDAAVCALVALRPALLRIARRVCGGDPDEDELAEVVAIAWEEICGDAGSLGATRVVAATWTRSRSVLRRRSDRAAREATRADGLDAVGRTHDPDVGGDGTLSMAVAKGVVSPQDAALIALTRVGGVRIVELARQRGVSASTLSTRRLRAEAAIRRHLTDGTSR
jgi:DNA-directed RNA polymerase specialized sigma24 family protein